MFAIAKDSGSSYCRLSLVTIAVSKKRKPAVPTPQAQYMPGHKNKKCSLYFNSIKIVI